VGGTSNLVTTAHESGAYRVECTIEYHGMERGWIFSNPIYIEKQEKSMAVSNNVTRMLDSRKVAYTALELPEEKLGAIETAEILNVPQTWCTRPSLSPAARGSPYVASSPETVKWI